VKITDFGLAERDFARRHASDDGRSGDGYAAVHVAGTSGRKNVAADARSDIFSLGVTLYEMLTGRPAFEGENVVQMLQQVIAEDRRGRTS